MKKISNILQFIFEQIKSGVHFRKCALVVRIIMCFLYILRVILPSEKLERNLQVDCSKLLSENYDSLFLDRRRITEENGVETSPIPLIDEEILKNNLTLCKYFKFGLDWYYLIWIEKIEPIWYCELIIAIMSIFELSILFIKTREVKRSIDFMHFTILFTVDIPLIIGIFLKSARLIFIPTFLYCWLAKDSLEILMNLMQTSVESLHLKQSTVSFQIGILSSTIVCVLFSGTCGIQHLQRAGGVKLSLFDSLWYIIVTFSTVGYGDIFPDIWIARAFMLIIIAAAFIYLPQKFEQLLYSWSQRAEFVSYRTTDDSAIYRMIARQSPPQVSRELTKKKLLMVQNEDDQFNKETTNLLKNKLSNKIESPKVIEGIRTFCTNNYQSELGINPDNDDDISENVELDIYQKQSSKHHVVICTTRVDSVTLLNFLNEFFSNPNLQKYHVILLTKYELDSTLRLLLNLSQWKERVSYIRGSALNDVDLRRAKINSARACFILSRSISDTDYSASDQHAVLRSWSVRDTAPNCPQFVQIHGVHNIMHVNFADYILCQEEIKFALLSKNCTCPGFSTFFTMLLSNIKKHDGSTAKRYLEKMYGKLSANEIRDNLCKNSPIFKDYIGKPFSHTSWLIHKEFGIGLIGIKRGGQENEKILINPGKSYRIKGDDTLLYMSINNEQEYLSKIPKTAKNSTLKFQNFFSCKKHQKHLSTNTILQRDEEASIQLNYAKTKKLEDVSYQNIEREIPSSNKEIKQLEINVNTLTEPNIVIAESSPVDMSLSPGISKLPTLNNFLTIDEGYKNNRCPSPTTRSHRLSIKHKSNIMKRRSSQQLPNNMIEQLAKSNINVIKSVSHELLHDQNRSDILAVNRRQSTGTKTDLSIQFPPFHLLEKSDGKIDSHESFSGNDTETHIETERSTMNYSISDLEDNKNNNWETEVPTFLLELKEADAKIGRPVPAYVGGGQVLCYLRGQKASHCCLRLNEKCDHIPYKIAADYSWKSESIIVAAEKSNLAMINFIIPLRAAYMEIGDLHPIVLLLEIEPDIAFLEMIAQFPLIYWMQGSVERIEDLLFAGVTMGTNLIVVNKESSNASNTEPILDDCNTIVAVQAVHRFFPNLRICTEIAHSSNMRFTLFDANDLYSQQLSQLEKIEKENGSTTSFMFRQSFASGAVFSSHLLETMLYQSFEKPYIISLCRLMLELDQESSSGFITSIELKNNIKYQSISTYGKLYEYLLVNEHGTIPIGVYRTVEKVKSKATVNIKKILKRSEKEIETIINTAIHNLHVRANYASYRDIKSKRSFVLINPESSFQLNTNDIIYVIRPGKYAKLSKSLSPEIVEGKSNDCERQLLIREME